MFYAYRITGGDVVDDTPVYSAEPVQPLSGGKWELASGYRFCAYDGPLYEMNNISDVPVGTIVFVTGDRFQAPARNPFYKD